MGGAKGGKGGAKEVDDEKTREQGKGRTRARAKAAEAEGGDTTKEVKQEKVADKGPEKGKGGGKAKGDASKKGGDSGKDGKGDKGRGKGKDGKGDKGKDGKGDKGKDGKGDKGKDGFGKGKDGFGKGKDSGKGKEAVGKGKDKDSNGGKGLMVQDLEAKISTKAKTGSGGSSKTNPFEAKGVYCDVKKHSDIGCAVVMMESEAACDAVLEQGKKLLSAKGRPQVKIGDLSVDMRRHPAEDDEAQNGIFVAWGRQVEKTTPLAASAIAEAFDDLWREIRGTTDLAAVGAPVLPRPAPAPAPAAPKAESPAPAGGLTPEQQMLGALGAQNYYAQLEKMAQVIAAQSGGATAANSAAAAKSAGAAPGSMRHDAPTFTPGASQQQQQQSQTQTQQQQQLQLLQQMQQMQQLQQMQQMQQYAEMTQMWYQNTPDSTDGSSSGGYFGVTERRPLAIKDPKSGEAIEAPVTTASAIETSFEPQAPVRKAMTIVDPTSGNAVDAMSVLGFRPAEPKQPMTIKDPKSGDIIKI